MFCGVHTGALAYMFPDKEHTGVFQSFRRGTLKIPHFQLKLSNDKDLNFRASV